MGRFFISVVLFTMMSAAAFAQQKTYSIKGTVVSKETGQPVEFATIVLSSTEQWAVADANGNFTIQNVQPGKTQISISCLGYVVFASLVSGMGTTVFAAHSIAVTAETIFYVPGYGLRTATSALIGTARGEKDDEKIAAVGKLSVLLTLGIMCVSGVILYIGAYPLMSLFTPSTAVVELGGEMLRIVALSEPFFGLMIVLEGIFYGLGRTRYAFGVETFGMWGVRIFSTFLCVRVWGLGLRAVWYCMIADNICKAVLFAVPFLAAWIRNRKSKGSI